MKDIKKVELIKALIVIAFADGKLDPREKEEIEKIINLLELTEEEEVEAKRYLANPSDVGKVNLALHEREEGIILYEYAFRIALSDKEIDPREMYILKRIQEYFKLTPKEVGEIEAEIKGKSIE